MTERIVPNNIPEFAQLDNGNYNFGIQKVTEETHTDGRLYYRNTMQVTDPLVVRGQIHSESFWIGTEEDLQAMQPETWQRNAGKMKGMCKAAGVPFEGRPMSQVLTELIGRTLGGTVETTMKKDKDGNMRKYANVRKWYAAGEKQAELAPTSGVPVGATAPPPLPPQVAPPPAQPPVGYVATPPQQYTPPATPAPAPAQQQQPMYQPPAGMPGPYPNPQ